MYRGGNVIIVLDARIAKAYVVSARALSKHELRRRMG